MEHGVKVPGINNIFITHLSSDSISEFAGFFLRAHSFGTRSTTLRGPVNLSNMVFSNRFFVNRKHTIHLTEFSGEGDETVRGDDGTLVTPVVVSVDHPHWDNYQIIKRLDPPQPVDPDAPTRHTNASVLAAAASSSKATSATSATTATAASTAAATNSSGAATTTTTTSTTTTDTTPSITPSTNSDTTTTDTAATPATPAAAAASDSTTLPSDTTTTTTNNTQAGSSSKVTATAAELLKNVHFAKGNREDSFEAYIHWMKFRGGLVGGLHHVERDMMIKYLQKHPHPLQTDLPPDFFGELSSNSGSDRRHINKLQITSFLDGIT
jgi:hypothetical protein